MGTLRHVQPTFWMHFGRVMVLVLCVAMLPACAWLLSIDPDKTTKIVTIDIGQVGVVSGTVKLPRGNAGLLFVVPGYDCAKGLVGTLLVEMRFGNGERVEHTIRLDELTWPSTSEGCVPIGYLRSEGSSRPSLDFVMSTARQPVEYRVTVREAHLGPERLSIWVDYNDRPDRARMLADGEGSPEP